MSISGEKEPWEVQSNPPAQGRVSSEGQAGFLRALALRENPWGWRLPSLSGQAAPVLDSPGHGKAFPSILFGPLLVWLMPVCLSLPPLPTVKNLALHRKSPYLTLSSLSGFWRGCVNPLQSSSFPTSWLHVELQFFFFLHNFLISKRSSLSAFYPSIFFWL